MKLKKKSSERRPMNLNRNRKKRPKKEAPLWMVTYSDMVTLILVFFILLFSMSQIDAEKLKTVTESYQQRVILDYYPSAVELDQASNLEDDEDENEFEGMTEIEETEELTPHDLEEQVDELERLLQQIEEYIRNEGLSDVISATRTEQGVVLVLQENVLFESGEAELIGDALPLLQKVATLLENIPNQVKVEGHTDPRPIRTNRFPSNWELSGARASSVVRYFAEEEDLEAERFQISGFADTRPIVPNDSSENMKKNRRVEIIILESD